MQDTVAKSNPEKSKVDSALFNQFKTPVCQAGNSAVSPTSICSFRAETRNPNSKFVRDHQQLKNEC
jgi:hypothetical protein